MYIYQHSSRQQQCGISLYRCQNTKQEAPTACHHDNYTPSILFEPVRASCMQCTACSEEGDASHIPVPGQYTPPQRHDQSLPGTGYLMLIKHFRYIHITAVGYEV